MPIGDGSQTFRDGNADGEAVRLIGQMILIRPPQAGADALAGHGGPGFAVVVFGPDKTAVPGRISGRFRPAAVMNAKNTLFPGCLPGKLYEYGISLAFKGERLFLP